MTPTQKKFRKADSREDMTPLHVWVPRDLHRKLLLARVERGVSVNEMVRQALETWFKRKGVR